jgi:acetate---CoA ligase (ADP-forming)
MTRVEEAVPVGRLLRPRSVAIVGVSDDAGSVGGQVLANLERWKYRGEIHLVSRNNSEVRGRRCVRTIDDLPEGIDAVVLAIPVAATVDAVAAAVRRRAGSIVVFAAGFAEADESGKQAQARIAQLAREARVTLLGPNTMGVSNLAQGVTLAFGPSAPDFATGHPAIGVLSQSGAMGGCVRFSLRARGIFVSCTVATGNEAASGVEDYLAALIDDEATDSIAIYAEQLRKPRLFLRLAARAAEKGKPIIMLHPGRSAAARDSAASHTGALAGDYKTMAALVSRAGVALVNTLEEFLDLSEMLTRFPKAVTGRPVVLTESGAFRGLCLDQSEAVGLELAGLAASTRAELARRLPPFAEISNPLDLTAQAMKDPALYEDSIRIAARDPECSAVVVAVMPGTPPVGLKKVEAILPALSSGMQPRALVLLGDAAPMAPEVAELAIKAGVPFFRSPERVIRTLAHMQRYARTKLEAPAVTPATRPAGERIAGSGTLTEFHSKAIISAVGIATPRGKLVRSLEEALTAAAEIGFPVVLKAQSGALPHKTEVGGVILDLRSDAQLRQGWHRLHDNIKQARPQLSIDAVLIEAMAPAGVELFVGGRNDPAWGPTLMFGLGGVWIEALEDLRLTPTNLTPAQIVTELDGLAAAKLLHGFRGSPPIDLEATARAIATVGCLVEEHPEIQEIDINPLVAYPAGRPPLALDALMIVAGRTP